MAWSSLRRPRCGTRRCSRRPCASTTRPWCTAIVGSIRSLRSVRSRARDPVLVGSGKPGAIADHVGHQDRRDFARFPPRRCAAATVSAVSGRPGKGSGRHREDARGLSIIGLSMAALLHAALRRTWKQGAQPCVSTGRSIHAMPSITPSPRERIDDGPRLPVRTCSNRAGRGPTRGPPRPSRAMGRTRPPSRRAAK